MNCDGIARYYEILEHLSFGRSLERRRFAFLGEARISRRAIVCGGGDGRFLAGLVRGNPQVEVDFVELSRKMVELAERRVAALGRSYRGRVRFCVGDVREFKPRTDGYDLIVTNFFLDCFSGPELSGDRCVSRELGDAGARNGSSRISVKQRDRSVACGPGR